MIEALRKVIDDGVAGLACEKLLPKPPLINFKPTISNCPSCQSPLKVYKTVTDRKIITLHIGAIVAHQTFLQCKNCGNTQVYSPEEIQKLVPCHSNFGYDIIEYIGRASFQRYRTGEEICNELVERNIPISQSEVDHLSRKFVIYLALAHSGKEKKLKEIIQHQGGYILHLDGTNEGGSPHLVSVLDELSKFVLASVKIPSENADYLIPLLRRIEKKYGNPLAIVSDMGKGILLAVREVFSNIPHFICHFHFLRDIGKDLLEKQYTVIRNTLKKYGLSTRLRYHLKQFENKDKEKIEVNFRELISSKNLPVQLNEHQVKALCYGLIHWALDGKNQGHGYGFPFDTPHWEFYKRLCEMYKVLENYNKKQINMTSKARKIIRRLLANIQPIVQDTLVAEASTLLGYKKNVFDKLRLAMRITLNDSKDGLNDNGNEADLHTIQQRVRDFTNWLSQDQQYQSKDYKKMIEQIEKYWEMLWADPITVKTKNGEIIITPQRTNNIMEQFFRSLRRSERRKTGNNSISKRLKTMIAETPLVKNLENPSYMRVLLDGKKTLAECFAEIDKTDVIKKLQQVDENQIDKIPSLIKKNIKECNIPEIYLNLVKC